MGGFDFWTVADYGDVLLAGMGWTALLTVASAGLSLVGGVAFALCSLGRRAALRWPTAFFVWLFMGTPLLLQLYLIYFGLVQIGIDLSAFAAGVIGLSLHFAVYNSEAIRAGIVAVDRGQHEASRSLGLGLWQTMRKVILPQALRNVTPALGNNMIALLKESSLVSIIGVMELTLSAQRAISETFRPFEFYIAAGAMYYVLNAALELVLRRVERRTEMTR